MNRRIFNWIVCVAAISTVGVLNAGTISVSPGIAMEPADLAGAPGVRVSNWNNWAYENWVLGDEEEIVVDDSGAAVPGFTVELNAWPISGRWKNENTSRVNEAALYYGVFDIFGSDWTVTASNIPYAYYDVYVYGTDSSATRGGRCTIGDTTYYMRGMSAPASDGTGYVQSTDTTQGAGTDIEQGNFVRFSGLSGSSFSLVLRDVFCGDTTQRHKVYGFQIVEKQIAPVVPKNGATHVSIDQELQWSVVDPNATHIDLYFGTEGDPNATDPAYKRLSMVPVTTTTWDPGTMDYQQTYYWHIDLYEPNEFGPGYIKTPGETWSFETETATPVIETYDNVVITMELLPAALTALVSDADHNLSSAAFAVTSSPAGSTYVLTEDVSDPYTPIAGLEPNMPGTYEVTLTVTDADTNTAEAIAEVVVYDDACAAAQAAPSWTGFNAMDFNHDCIVDLKDLVSFTLQWLDDRELAMQEIYPD